VNPLAAFDQVPPGNTTVRNSKEGVAMRNGVSLGTLVWLIIGVVVALSHGYSIANFSSLVSFLLAMFLWPLILLGVSLHVNLGV
jgi:hypothetical protein